MFDVRHRTAVDGRTQSMTFCSHRPKIVIPMHYRLESENVPLDKIDKFLQAMGLDDKDVSHQEVLKIQKKDIPEEGLQLVLLEAKR